MSSERAVEFDEERLGRICRDWRVRELALFGSVIREDFGPDSDVDVLVTFEDDAPWSLWDLMRLREELVDLFGRPVDLVERDAIRNPFRRDSILNSHRVVYAA
jgi:predicted nucleotidyltransferase